MDDLSQKYNFIGLASDGLIVVEDWDNKWGFIDDVNGEEVIPCKFDKVDKFSNGFAAVRKSNKWGYIDRTGNMVIAFKYDHAGRFNSDGFAHAIKNSEAVLIEKSGEELPKIFSEYYYYSDIFGISILDLPKEIFGNDTALKIIIKRYQEELNTKLSLCKTEKELEEAKAYLSFLSEYIKDFAYEEYCRKQGLINSPAEKSLDDQISEAKDQYQL